MNTAEGDNRLKTEKWKLESERFGWTMAPDSENWRMKSTGKDPECEKCRFGLLDPLDATRTQPGRNPGATPTQP